MSELVKSAARVFEILEQFGKARHPLRLRDIVRELNHPTSSVAALLKSMTAQGYLNFDAHTRTYIPTSRLALMLNWVPTETFEQGIVLECMREVQRATNELVVLAVENGIHLEYVETLRSTEGMQLYIAPGTRRLLVQTATGWQFLNRRPEADAIEVYRKTIAMGELTEREFPVSDFLERLRDHRTREISFIRARDLVRPTAHWGGGMVSILIPVPSGHRSLAIGVGGPADRLEHKMELISAALKSAASKIAVVAAEMSPV